MTHSALDAATKLPEPKVRIYQESTRNLPEIEALEEPVGSGSQGACDRLGVIRISERRPDLDGDGNWVVHAKVFIEGTLNETASYLSREELGQLHGTAAAA